jgi:MarR family transcriptional regulator, negative regulator of the multidrug operon emrRAB
MNSSTLQIQKLEANLERLHARVPDMPISCVLLCRLIQHLGRSMTLMLEQQIRPFGLGEAEFRVLTTLFSQPDGAAHPTELCVKTDQSPANMSRISDALVSLGLITRDSSLHDRRKMVLRVTEQGEDLVRRLLPMLGEPLREMFREFSDQEQKDLADHLKRLNDRLVEALARQAATAERVE